VRLVGSAKTRAVLPTHTVSLSFLANTVRGMPIKKPMRWINKLKRITWNGHTAYARGLHVLGKDYIKMNLKN
jgi:hypothetical protein